MAVYEITVGDNAGSTWDTSKTYYYPTVTTGTWSYNAHVYLYQLLCPAKKCGVSNWCELDKSVSCKGCGSTLKAVTKKADFEVEVG